MASLIQKAAHGNRPALIKLYEANKQTVFYIVQAILRSDAASSITYKSIKSAIQALINGEISSEEEFTQHSIKQAILNCKQEIIKKDAKAFRAPAKKDFRLLHINEAVIDPELGSVNNYLNCLPVLHRFILVLHYAAKLPAGQIGVFTGMEPGIIERAFDAEMDNLSRIYRCVKANGGKCTAPTTEMLKNAFNSAIAAELVPHEIDEQIDDFIFDIVEPAWKKIQQKQKNICILAGILVVCALGLAALFSSSNKSAVEEITASTTASTVAAESEEAAVPEETAATEPFNIVTTEATEANTAEAEAENVDVTSYSAQIEIENYGTITVALDSEAAPITVENFVSLAESGFYDGLTFHRIIEGFMMQGGDPNGDGTGGSEETIVGEFSENGYDNALSHTRGAISMARSDEYDSASSQFFIVHEDSTYLDGQYAVFGYITEGMDIVDAICEAAEPIDSNGTIDFEAQPVINSITIQVQE